MASQATQIRTTALAALSDCPGRRIFQLLGQAGRGDVLDCVESFLHDVAFYHFFGARKVKDFEQDGKVPAVSKASAITYYVAVMAICR